MTRSSGEHLGRPLDREPVAGRVPEDLHALVAPVVRTAAAGDAQEAVAEELGLRLKACDPVFEKGHPPGEREAPPERDEPGVVGVSNGGGYEDQGMVPRRTVPTAPGARRRTMGRWSSRGSGVWGRSPEDPGPLQSTAAPRSVRVVKAARRSYSLVAVVLPDACAPSAPSFACGAPGPHPQGNAALLRSPAAGGRRSPWSS